MGGVKKREGKEKPLREEVTSRRSENQSKAQEIELETDLKKQKGK